MNRSLDYRCDYYSLGALLYELVSGEPPFPSDDPLACVSAHISETPRPPQAPGREVPPCLSDIILKLLSKGAEDRYQSGFGLIADLKEAQRRWAAGERQSHFQLATKDVPRYFSVSQKCYGREKEIRLLEEAFEKVFSSNEAQMVLVSGASGIGKSTLINEVHKPLLRRRGIFIKGKFNQFSRDTPYDAFISAFSSLADHFLTLPESQLTRVRERLLKTLGHNARIAVDLVPKLGLILGDLPELEDLGSIGNANRFRLALDAIVVAIVQKEYPLVIFIDDLQWADGGSLGLIQNIFERRQGTHLFFIGAYRDNEVDQLHPLTRCLQNLTETGLDIARVSLNPLSETDLGALIADSLYSSVAETRDICHEIMLKTHGNPFFVHEVLTQLYHAKAFNFSAKLGRWEWSIENIRSLGLSSNVIDFLLIKIKSLGHEVIPLLAHAACIGHEFDLKTLSELSGQGLQEVSSLLAAPCQEHILVYEGPSFLFQHASSEERSPDTYEGIKYRFVHDRVQQACHTLFSEEEIRKIKLRYGIYLLKHSNEEDVNKNLIVQITELYNGGLEYIEVAAERSHLVNLNLLAARKSAASLSYGSAVKFARFGLKLLEDIDEEGHSDTYQNLMLIAAEGEYSNQNAEAAEQLFEKLLSKGGDPYSLALIYEKKAALCGMTGQYEKACLSGLEALKVLNVNLPAKPHALHGIIETMRVLQLAAKLRKHKLLSKRILSPPVDDERHKLIISVLESIQYNAYQYDINLFTLVTAYATKIILKKGNTEGASNFYNTLALFTLIVTQNNMHSAEIAELGMKYGKTYEPNLRLAKALFGSTYALLHWSRDVKESTSLYVEVEELLIQCGEFTWLDSTRASRLFYFAHHAPHTQDLVKSTSEMEGVTKLKISQAAKPAYCFAQQFLQVMNGQVSSIVVFREEDGWQKETIDTAMQKNPTTSTASAYLVLQAQAFVIFNRYEEAVTSLKHCELNKIVGTISVAYYNFFLGLCASALHQKQVMRYYDSRRKLHSVLNKFRKWALDVPVNFKHFALILEAELQLFKGQYLKATALYDEAISTAEQYSYFWVAGLAADRCAEMYLELRQHRLAETYLKLAYGFYQTYGAMGKLQQLLVNHPNVFSKANQTHTSTALNKTFHGTIAHTHSQTYQHGDVLDVTAITRAAQAISGSIRIDELLSKLLAILRQ
ncbi:MAG TPA: AAA family ATPase, partial [Oligoflexus sp.]